MIKVKDLSYWYGQKDLYNKISFTIEQGQHCAFIGVNGSGKTTLVDLILNPDKHIFDGEIEIDPSLKIGYISQFLDTNAMENLTVFQYIGGKSIELQEEIDFICKEMETSDDIDSLLVKYQETSDAFDALGGNEFEMEINKKLNLVGLINHKHLLVSELSGGEFKLVQVIKEMLNKKDLMIMDEPDVFLDFENLIALKELINSYKETLIVITHNRFLLNHCFNKIIHLENMEVQEFDGRYVDYNYSLLEAKIEVQELALNDTEEIARNKKLVERFQFESGLNSDASIGKHVSSRRKILERLEARRIKPPFLFINHPNIKFESKNNLDDEIILDIMDLNISFEENLLENINFSLASKEKVAIIGPNGSGKTSLLRKISQNSSPSVKYNENANYIYLSQIQGEMLDESNTVLQEFLDLGFEDSQASFSYLSTFGFNEDILYQKIGSLSGGEKNLLQLAKISSSKADILILDEPTSHLDLYSQVALEKAIEDYKGSVLMVSHDFYFIINSMDYVLIIEDKSIRKMNIKKFKRMIYNNYFDKDYTELEESKKTLERKIEEALIKNDFDTAKSLAEDLKLIIDKM